MKTFKFINAPRGFSMIEVLISVVILGFGLLALAALQTTIIRSSSETKAQTVALQLAKDKIEDLRSFQDLAGYNALTTGNDSINDSSGSLSGVNFTRVWTVTRFAYNSAGAVVAVTPNVGAITTAGTYTSDNEYKRVVVSVSWTDANGATQTIGLEDGLGAISPGDSSKTTVNNAGTSQSRKPRVYIYDPGLTGGVIPIAIGNGSSTAASNPTPVFTGSSTSVAETLFEVLTYSGAIGSVVAQSRVETAVVGCTCSTANAPTGKGYRPAYWNGYRYAPPTLTSDAPKAGWTIPGGNKTAESDRCTACCRDHRDPTGIAGAKFDPWRTTHAHYLRSNSTTLTIAPTGTYSEACRLIRVDGFFRVAPDFKNDYFGFLETNNNGDITATNQNLRAYAPKVDTVTINGVVVPTANDSKKKYENFILDYMDDRMSNNTSYTYNTPLATSGYEATYDLNSPTTTGVAQPIPLKATAVFESADSKWTHARGLYIDWIEPDALDVIKNANTKCADKSTQLNRNTCVLPYVPFTTVNLTELAYFTPKLTATDAAAFDDSVITVVNNALPDAENKPTRGNVYKGTASPLVNNSSAFALSYMTASNSGIALKETIDTDETTLNDYQQYIISTSGGSNSSAVAFKVDLLTTSTTTFPASMSSIPNVLNYLTPYEPCSPASSTATSSNSQTCSFAPDSNNDMNIKVTGYTKINSINVPNGCYTSGNVTMPIVFDFDVDSATNFTSSTVGTIVSNGTSNGTDNTVGDYTVLKFNSVVANNKLEVFFSPVDRRCPSNYRSSVVNKVNAKDADPTNYACTGGGPNVKPTWSSTFVQCPDGTP